MRAITLIFSTLKKIIKWKRSSLRQSFLKISVTGNLHHLMIGSTKLFINSDSQKEILLNWDQLRWFNHLKRGRIVLTRLAGKNQEILEPTDLDSHTTIVTPKRVQCCYILLGSKRYLISGAQFSSAQFLKWKERRNLNLILSTSWISARSSGR